MVRQALATWREQMTRATGLSAASRTEYARDVESFVACLEHGGFGGTVAEVTAQDVRDYRDHLVDGGRAPATVNRLVAE